MDNTRLDQSASGSRSAPPYGWLTGLAHFLNQEVGQGNWAFTGSFAMYCWAWTKDGVARHPEDIDILVATDKFENVAYRLNSVYKATKFNPPNPRSVMTSMVITLDVVDEAQKAKKVETKLDVLRAEQGYGNLNSLTLLNGNAYFPVISVDALIDRKRAILKDHPGNEKAIKDIEFLQTLK